MRLPAADDDTGVFVLLHIIIGGREGMHARLVHTSCSLAFCFVTFLGGVPVLLPPKLAICKDWSCFISIKNLFLANNRDPTTSSPPDTQLPIDSTSLLQKPHPDGNRWEFNLPYLQMWLSVTRAFYY